jgi:hypothetical protein
LLAGRLLDRRRHITGTYRAQRIWQAS